MAKKKPLGCNDEFCLSLPNNSMNLLKIPREPHPLNNFYKDHNTEVINLAMIVDRWNRDGKIIEELVISSDKVAKYETTSLLDTGSQVSLIDDKLVNILKAKDSINCGRSIRIRDLSGDPTQACCLSIPIKYRNVDEHVDFFVINRLEQKIGAPILIGSDIVKKEIDKTGKFELIPKESEKVQFRAERRNTYPVPYQPSVMAIVESFKQFGNFDDVAEKFNLSINKVYLAILRKKRFRNDAEYCCWILKQQSKINPNWWEEAVVKVDTFLTKIDALDTLYFSGDINVDEPARQSEELLSGTNQSSKKKRSFKKIKGFAQVIGQKSKKAGQALKKGAAGAARGLKKGATVAGKGIKKGAKMAGKQVKKVASEQYKRSQFKKTGKWEEKFYIKTDRALSPDRIKQKLKEFANTLDPEVGKVSGCCTIIITAPAPKKVSNWNFMAKFTIKTDSPKNILSVRYLINSSVSPRRTIHFPYADRLKDKLKNNLIFHFGRLIKK